MARRGRRRKIPAKTPAEAEFCRIYRMEKFSDELEIPEAFVSKYLKDGPDSFKLETVKGTWDVSLKKADELVYFSTGWSAFVRGNNVLNGDLLTFRFKGGSDFEVSVYGLHCCRKDVDLSRTSGSRSSFWASSKRTLAPILQGFRGASQMQSPKEESSEEESQSWSGGHRSAYPRRGAYQRRGRGGFHGTQAYSRDDGRRSMIPPHKRGRGLSSSSEGDGSRGRRIPPRKRGRKLSSGSEGDGSRGGQERAGRSMIRPRMRERMHSYGSEGDGRRRIGRSISPPYYKGRRLPSGSDDGSGSSRTVSSDFGSNRDGLNTGTLRSKFPAPLHPHQAKMRGSGGEVSARYQPKEDLRRNFEEEGRGGYYGGAQRRGRSLYGSDDDNGREAYRSIYSETSPRHPSKPGSYYPPYRRAKSHTGWDRVPARFLQEEEFQNSFREDSIDVRESLYYSSDDGIRSAERRILRRTLSISGSGTRAGTSRSYKATPKFPPQPQSEYHSSRGGLSPRLYPKDDLRNSLEEEVQGGSGHRRGRMLPFYLEDDMSDDGRRDSVQRFRAQHNRHSSGRGGGPRAGPSRPRAELQNSLEEYSSDGGAAEDDFSDDGSRGGRMRKRASPNHISRDGYGPRAGVIRPHMPIGKFAPQSRARLPSSSGGPSARMYPRDEPIDISEEEGRGGYYGGSARPMRDDFSNDDYYGREGGRRMPPRRHHKNGRDGWQPGPSGSGATYYDD